MNRKKEKTKKKIKNREKKQRKQSRDEIERNKRENREKIERKQREKTKTRRSDPYNKKKQSPRQEIIFHRKWRGGLYS